MRVLSPRSAWAKQYMGLPYLEGGRAGRQGVDCFGLARLIWQERYGIDLASFEAVAWTAERTREVAACVAENCATWDEIARGHEQEGDGILLRVRGWPIHMGVVIEPGFMLHIEKGADSCIEEYGGLNWGRRIVGFYRCRQPCRTGT